MTALDSPEFFELLTDALRGGPGSPRWQQAVDLLRDAGAEGDEYRMLIRAREHLASGRDYRSIRPGPGFTRCVLENLGSAPSRSPAVDRVAAVAAGVVLAIVAVMLWAVFPRVGETPSSLAALSMTAFVSPVADVRFNPGQLPPQWRQVGALPLVVAEDGLYPRPRTGNGMAGAAMVLSESFAEDEPMALEVRFNVRQVTDNLSLEVFVTDRDEFSADRSTTPSEFTWTLHGEQVRVVLPDGRLGALGRASLTPASQRVRVRVARDVAIVNYNGTPLWQGINGLSKNGGRRLGVRFVSIGPSEAPIRVDSIRVMRPAR